MAQKAKPEEIEKLRTQILEVAEEIGFRNESGQLMALAKALEERDVTTVDGGKWYHGKSGASALSRFVKQYMPELRSGTSDKPEVDLSDSSERSELIVSESSELSQLQRATGSEASEVSEHGMTKEEILKLIRTEVASALSSVQTFPNVPMEADTPPEPIRKEGGRAFVVQRVKIAGTTDPVLLELFENERKQRKISVSRMIDTVLWNYFRKPKLSFERSDNSDT